MRQMGHTRAVRSQRRRQTSWNLRTNYISSSTDPDSMTDQNEVAVGPRRAHTRHATRASRRKRHSRMLTHRRQRRLLLLSELRQAHPAPVHRHAQQRQFQLHTPILEHPPALHLDCARERDRLLLRRRCRYHCRVHGGPEDLRDEEQVLCKDKRDDQYTRRKKDVLEGWCAPRSCARPPHLRARATQARPNL